METSFFEPWKGTLQELISKDHPLVFLVGAGISLNPPSNVPSARPLMQTLLNHTIPEKELLKIQTIPLLRYELLIEQFQNRLDPELKLMNFFTLFTRPNLIHFFLAANILQKRNVITTNFDMLIEQALVQIIDPSKQKNIIPVITKQDFLKYADPSVISQSNLYPIYKIHGSKINFITKENTTETLITTLNALGRNREQGKTFSIEPFKRPTFENLTKSHTLVVMGYSGNDDFDIGPMLEELTNLNALIWIEHAQNQEITIEKVNCVEGFRTNYSNLEQSLISMADKLPERIYRIKGDTLSLIQKELWKILISQYPIPNLNKFDSSKSINPPNFQEYILPFFEKMTITDRYLMACAIYNKFSMHSDVIRCSEEGFKQCVIDKKLDNMGLFYNYQGVNLAEMGDDERALSVYIKGIEYAKQSQDKNLEITINTNIGELYSKLARYDEAIKIFDQNFVIAQKLNNLDVMIGTLHNKAAILLTQGNIDEALKIYTKLIQSEEKWGDLEVKSAILGNYGLVLVQKNDIEKGIHYINEAIKIDELLGNMTAKISKLNNLGTVFHKQKKGDEALKYYFQAFNLAKAIDNKQIKAQCALNVAILFADGGDFPKANALALNALSIFSDIHDDFGIAKTILIIGDVQFQKRDFVSAEESFSDALQTFSRLGNKEEIATAQFKLAMIDKKLAKWSDAIDRLQKSIAILHDLGDEYNQAYMLLELGDTYLLYRNPKGGIDPFTRAVELFKKLGLNEMEQKALRQLDFIDFQLKK